MKKTILKVNGKVLVEINHLEETVAGEEYDENDDLIEVPIHEYVLEQVLSNMNYDGVSEKHTIETEVVET